MASAWMLINLFSRILAKYVALLGDKRNVLLSMIFLQYIGLLMYKFGWVGVYWCFFSASCTSGFVQTLLPMMMVNIYREQAWLYDKVCYPVSLIFCSLFACFLLQGETKVVYLWCLLSTSIGFLILSFGKFQRYVPPIQLSFKTTLD